MDEKEVLLLFLVFFEKLILILCKKAIGSRSFFLLFFSRQKFKFIATMEVIFNTFFFLLKVRIFNDLDSQG